MNKNVNVNVNVNADEIELYIINTQYGYFVSLKKFCFGIETVKSSFYFAYVLNKTCLIIAGSLYNDQDIKRANDEFIKDAVDNDCELITSEEDKFSFPVFKELNDAIKFRNILNAKQILNQFKQS